MHRERLTRMRQLAIDFKPQPMISGKKLSRLTVACSEEFLEILDRLARMHRLSRAEFAHALIVEGMQKSLGSVFMAEPHLEKRLSELLA